MRLWGTGGPNGCGPHSPLCAWDVLCEEDPASCLRAAEQVQGERGNANVCPGGPHLEPPTPEEAVACTWASLASEAGSSTHGGKGTASASSMCFLGTPPLGLATRSLEGQRGPWLEGAGRPGSTPGQVSGFQNPRKRVRAQEKMF